jgi:hypothetical protein
VTSSRVGAVSTSDKAQASANSLSTKNRLGAPADLRGRGTAVQLANTARTSTVACPTPVRECALGHHCNPLCQTRGVLLRLAMLGREHGSPTHASECRVSRSAGSFTQQRYRRLELLGKGGLCEIHRAIDETHGREVALKQLLAAQLDRPDASAQTLLEGEFLTLKQLQHPSIIEVYDYGVDDELGPYYTMELLSGTDLHGLAPLDWREACRLLLDVASSLAVLHSRRLLHRDVTARNVRRTSDGRAKLLDFGAMTEMGLPVAMIGTPPYMPPEAVHRLPLDGRADLYSLGALAYWLLTAEHAYHARWAESLKDAWRTRPRSPHSLVRGVPKELSALVMSLLQLDALNRPQSAAEVMTRLCSIADLPVVEDAAVQHAYLIAPKLLARDVPLLRLRKLVIRALRGHGGVLMIEADAGLGRSRFIDACVLEAQLAGACVARADASVGSRPFGMARRVVDGLLESRPDLQRIVEQVGLGPFLGAGGETRTEPGAGEPNRAVALTKFGAFLRQASERHLIMIAVDDVHCVDEPSVAVLAEVAQQADALRMALVLSADAAYLQRPGLALRVLFEASRRHRLEPFTAEYTRALLSSVFGEIPNLDLLSSMLHDTCAGNPRELMNAAQRLVDAGVARYEGGRWFLTDEAAKISACVKGGSAVEERLAALSPDARRLVAMLALDRDAQLEYGDYAAAFGPDSAARVHDALAELSRARLLVRADEGHRFYRASDQAGIAESVPESLGHELHLILAECMKRRQVEPIYEAYHLVQAGRPGSAHDAMRRQMAMEVARASRTRKPIELDTIERMVAVGAHERWPLPMLTQYRTFCCWLAAVSGAYERVQPLAAETLSALAHYGGLTDYEALADLPSDQRLQQALASAHARFTAIPAEEQPMTPAAALGALTRVGALAATCGYLMADPALFSVIPSLAPLAPLSPAFAFADRLIGAFRNLTHGQLWAGWDELRKLHQDVVTLTAEQLEPHNRYALELASLSGLCSFDAKYATSTALARCDALARMQPDQAENYRMLYHLARGRLAEAERSRKRCELLTLQGSATDDTRITRLLTQMVIYPLTEDLMGLKHTIEGLDEVVQKRPGWRYRRDCTRARELRCRGRLEEALAVIEGSLQELPVNHFDWCPTVEEQVVLLTQLGRHEQAASLGAEYSAQARSLAMPTAWLDLALAVSLSACGRHTEAQTRWQGALDALAARDIGGVHLGYAHEVGARIAWGRGDHAAFEVHERACAAVYTSGQYPALTARYNRLLEVARGGASLPVFDEPAASERGSEFDAVRTALTDCAAPEEYAARALALMCEHTGGDSGTLFVVQGGRLQPLTAAQDLEPSLLAQAEDYLSAELESSRVATRTFMDDLTVNPDAARDAARYQPVVLRTRGADAEQIVGIAMLDNQPHPLRAPSPRFISALSDALLDVGIAEAMSAAL